MNGGGDGGEGGGFSLTLPSSQGASPAAAEVAQHIIEKVHRDRDGDDDRAIDTTSYKRTLKFDAVLRYVVSPCQAANTSTSFAANHQLGAPNQTFRDLHGDVGFDVVGVVQHLSLIVLLLLSSPEHPDLWGVRLWWDALVCTHHSSFVIRVAVNDSHLGLADQTGAQPHCVGLCRLAGRALQPVHEADEPEVGGGHDGAREVLGGERFQLSARE
mmetsp:Transcript_21076/g.45710  ORF Transcript_21076/g.45710 Transcript_21076/m.45710 type:complete len:214 (-) Transcript_21076:217-858(-)